MTLPTIRVPLMVGFIPCPIEAEWDPGGAHLAGFPLNIVYSSMQPDGTGAEERFVACYWFDEGTYREDDTVREMAYASRDESPYHVLVRYQKVTGLVGTTTRASATHAAMPLTSACRWSAVTFPDDRNRSGTARYSAKRSGEM